MNRRFSLLLSFALASAWPGFVSIGCAQFPAGPTGGAGGTSTTDPTDGLIHNKPPSDAANRLNCWISRSGSRAIAVSVYKDKANQNAATFRQYAVDLTDPEADHFDAKPTTITGQPAPIPYVRVSLTEVTTSPNTFVMNYYPGGFSDTDTPIGTPVVVGWLKFMKGNSGRNTSDLVIRLHSSVQRAGTSTSSSTSPCDEPPVDDLGEEEETALAKLSGVSVPNTPSKVMSLTFTLPPETP